MGYFVIKEAAVLSVAGSLVAVVVLTLTMTIVAWLSEDSFAIVVIGLCLLGLLRLGLEVLLNIWSRNL